MINYSRMILVYLAEMQLLKEFDPDIYQEFKQGNWVVNKNPRVPFCSLGADNALEHVNRSMKVSGGLIGITLNTNAALSTSSSHRSLHDWQRKPKKCLARQLVRGRSNTTT